MPELTQHATDLPRGAAPVGPAEYQRVIKRVREEVARIVPSGSIVLVVSRGDEELIRFPNHRGWHFPRATGGDYGGYHPESGDAALAHLEELRVAGASHVVFPRTAFWWFEYYEALAEYLRSRARLLADERDACLIFALHPSNKNRARNGSEWFDAPSQMPDLVEALLPQGCDIAVALGEGEKASGFGERRVWHLRIPEGESSDSRGELESWVQDLHELRSAAVQYLVVPRSAERLVRRFPEFRRYLQTFSCPIMRQRNVGAIYELEAERRSSLEVNGNETTRGRP